MIDNAIAELGTRKKITAREIDLHIISDHPIEFFCRKAADELCERIIKERQKRQAIVLVFRAYILETDE